MFSVSRAATIIVATTALVASIGTSEPLPSSQDLSRSMSRLVLNEEVAADMTFPDDGVWIEIDEALYSEINSGNTDRLDLYLDPLSGVQEDRLLRDFPTRHNLDVAGQAIEERGSAEVQSRGSEIGADVQVERVGTRIEKNPHGCHLLPYGTKGVSGGVMYMHRRTDSGSSKYGIIGWKPYTRCVTAQLRSSMKIFTIERQFSDYGIPKHLVPQASDITLRPLTKRMSPGAVKIQKRRTGWVAR